MIRKLLKTIGLVAVSIYLYFAYQLLVIPGALDFSYYGVFGFAAAALLAIFILPKKLRFSAALFYIGILMIAKGFDNVLQVSIILRILDFIIITAVIGWFLCKYAKIRWITTACSALAILVLTYTFPMADVPFLSHFSLQYQSPNLVDPMTTVYPAYPIDVMPGFGHSGNQIVTESNRPNRWISSKLIDSTRDAMFVSVVLNKKPQESLMKANQLNDSLFADFGTVGFPYDTYTLYNIKGYAQQEFRPLHQPQEILQNVLDMANFPVWQTNMELTTLHADKLAWELFQNQNGSTQQNTNQDPIRIVNHHIIGSYAGKMLDIKTDDVKVLGVSHLLAGTANKQIVTEGSNRLDVYDNNSGKLLAAYQSNIDTPLPGSIIFGDVDGDGQDEILLDTVPARILKLTQNEQWKTLWVSPKDSFRFESVGKLGQDSTTTIVANAPSFVRDVPTRYMTGYVYHDGTLEQKWKISRGSLIFPQLVNFQNSDQYELLATDYGTQKMYILKEQHIPVQIILGVIYGLYVLFALLFRVLWKGGRTHA